MYYLYAKSTLLLSRFNIPLKHKRKFGLISFVFFGVFLFIFYNITSSNYSFAQSVGGNVGTGIVGDWLADGVAWIALQMATLFLKLSIFVLKFIIEIGGYNGYINAPAVEVGWVMVRDLANMFFVVALLLIAFGTILGLEQYEWKKLMVKLFFAAILVNFSRVICGIMIDAAQVVMMTFINGVVATAGGNLINAFNLHNSMHHYEETEYITIG